MRGGHIKEYAVRLRHDGLSLIILSQVYKLLDPVIRRNMSTIHVWEPPNNEETEIIAQDITPGLLRRNEFAHMLHDATSETQLFDHPFWE